MVCPEKEKLDTPEYLKDFRRKVLEERVPLTGTIDVTHRCNLKCAHCYVRSTSGQSVPAEKELTTGQIVRIIEACAEAGCLSLVLTGGEPLIRSDFIDIYRAAKTSGLFVTVFTNGTLITPEILDVFADLPPRAVEITLYGATEKSCEQITGVPGSLRRCRAGIEALLERNIAVRIKTMLMRQNCHEFADIESLARDYGVMFRFDASLFPRLDGDRRPLDFRVSPDEAVEKDFSDAQRAREWKTHYEASADAGGFETLYGCGAGATNFHVDPCGRLQPCMMIPWIGYDLIGGRFAEGWENIRAEIAGRKMPADSACKDCRLKNLCGYCPAFFRAETGSEMNRSEYLCSLGRRRFDKIRRDE